MDYGDKLDGGEKAKVQVAVDRLKDAIKREDLNEVKSASDALQTIWHEVAAKIYQTQGAYTQAGSTAGSDGDDMSSRKTSETKTDSEKRDDAVDADYEVVN